MPLRDWGKPSEFTKEGAGSKVPEAHGGGLEREERTELETTMASKPDDGHFEDTDCDLLGEI